MLEPTSPPDEKMSLPLQVQTDQDLSQVVASRIRSRRFLWTGLGSGVLLLIGVSACAFHGLVSDAEPSQAVTELAFNPMPALAARGILPPRSSQKRATAVRTAIRPGPHHTPFRVTKPLRMSTQMESSVETEAEEKVAAESGTKETALALKLAFNQAAEEYMAAEGGFSDSNSETVFRGTINMAELKALSVEEGGRLVEGVHADPDRHPLAANVLRAVPELASWNSWYRPPVALTNGNVHTILAAKLRKTRAVRYYRELLRTPDGGTLALDMLTGLQHMTSGDKGSDMNRWAGLLSGSAVAGASEEDSDTVFVEKPLPPYPERPLLLLLSGLGGGSQDTYVRSMGAEAAERGWQVVVLNMRACGSSPVTSPRLFSAYKGANDDVRLAVQHLRKTRLAGEAGTSRSPLAVIGWSNSGTILNNVLAEQATTHTDPAYAIDAGASLAAPLDMPTSNANLQRFFHRQIYDRSLGKSLKGLWQQARDQFVDPVTGLPIEVPQWDGLGDGAGTFLAADDIAMAGTSIRELDEALTRRQYGFADVDEYYADASSDQRLGLVSRPLLVLNAYDDPIVPGYSLARGLANGRDNPNIVMAVTLSGGHLGWCDPIMPWGPPTWSEQVALGFLETALDIDPASTALW